MFGLEEILMKYFDKCGLELRSSSSPDKDSQFGLFLKLASQGNVEIGSEHKTDSLRYALIKKRYYLGNFPNNGGGVFPNPKTFVNLPSIFLYAKFILRC